MPSSCLSGSRGHNDMTHCQPTWAARSGIRSTTRRPMEDFGVHTELRHRMYVLQVDAVSSGNIFGTISIHVHLHLGEGPRSAIAFNSGALFLRISICARPWFRVAWNHDGGTQTRTRTNHPAAACERHFRSVDEVLASALASLPRDLRFDRENRREAVRRMIEFGERRKPSLGESVTGQFLHEGHRF